jgi:hypothetical protein
MITYNTMSVNFLTCLNSSIAVDENVRARHLTYWDNITNMGLSVDDQILIDEQFHQHSLLLHRRFKQAFVHSGGTVPRELMGDDSTALR